MYVTVRTWVRHRSNRYSIMRLSIPIIIFSFILIFFLRMKWRTGINTLAFPGVTPMFLFYLFIPLIGLILVLSIPNIKSAKQFRMEKEEVERIIKNGIMLVGNVVSVTHDYDLKLGPVYKVNVLVRDRDGHEFTLTSKPYGDALKDATSGTQLRCFVEDWTFLNAYVDVDPLFDYCAIPPRVLMEVPCDQNPYATY